MIAHHQHSIGAPDSAAGMFFINRNRSGGDLRIMHFPGLHSLQLLPLIALAGAHRNRLLAVHLPAILLLLFTTFVFVQALEGKSFFA